MCVTSWSGAEPLFLDYLAVGKMLPEQVTTIVAGGCRLAARAAPSLAARQRKCLALPAGEYDLAGFAVG